MTVFSMIGAACSNLTYMFKNYNFIIKPQMECIKEFLDTSTIHGLSHISTSKSLVVKLAWACMVIASFTVAAILIHNAFTSWEKSPVITSSGTLHISNVKFPKVTVCPPKDTNTGLNHVFEKSRYTADLLPPQMGDLEGYSIILAQDEYHLEYVEEMFSFTNIENIRNYYKGVTKFTLPYYESSKHTYFVFTSATEGFISTPWFGEPLILKFNKHLFYKYIFEFPTNLSDLVVDGSLVLEVVVDTMEFSKEIEEVRIYPIMWGKQEFYHNKTIKLQGVPIKPHD